jgi:hypothetical protein
MKVDNMKIKKRFFIFPLLLVLLVLAIGSAHASIPSMSVVIGNKAFSLSYANSKENQSEITAAVLASDGKIFIKDFADKWRDNNTNNVVSPNIIPEVQYTDIDGTKKFNAGDNEEVIATPGDRFEVISIE